MYIPLLIRNDIDLQHAQCYIVFELTQKLLKVIYIMIVYITDVQQYSTQYGLLLLKLLYVVSNSSDSSDVGNIKHEGSSPELIQPQLLLEGVDLVEDV